MMLLLDTCAVLWLADDQDRISGRAKAALEGSAGSLFVSAITAFEIAHRHRRGKLELPLEPAEWYLEALETHGLTEIPITGEIASRAVDLPPIHRDPCDRFIIATAQLKNLVVVTADVTIPQYPDVKVLW